MMIKGYTPHLKYAALALASAMALSACDDSTTDPAPEYDASQVISDIGTKVILATYVDLDAKGSLLLDAVNTLKSARTEQNLDAAKQAWKDARRPWEQSEAFLFGPVDAKGIDPSIDDWPLNKTDLDGVLSSSSALTKDFIDAQETNLKGFHTIEYLLFGSGNRKTVGDFTDREFEYLTAVVESFKGNVSKLKTSWEPTGENYLDTLIKAGNGSGIYTTQKSALAELVNGMIGICDEVATGKINDPFTLGDRGKEESQFSDNSNLDFADNIRSVQNIYLGQYGSSSGAGLTVFVSDADPELDTRLKSEIAAAITAIGQMTPTFGEAITHNKAKVTAAQDAILKVKATLESDILPLTN